MILTPTCYLLRRPDGSYALALNEQGNDAAQIAAADLPTVARLLSMAAAFTLLGQQHDARPGLTVSSQPRSGGDSAESSPIDAYLRQKAYVELGILPHPSTGNIL